MHEMPKVPEQIAPEDGCVFESDPPGALLALDGFGQRTRMQFNLAVPRRGADGRGASTTTLFCPKSQNITCVDLPCRAMGKDGSARTSLASASSCRDMPEGEIHCFCSKVRGWT